MKNLDYFEDFVKYINSLDGEKRFRVLYVVDYVMNYYVGDRRIPELWSLGLESELRKLKDLGIINEKYNYWRGNRYLHYYINDEIRDLVEKLVIEEFYPLISEKFVTETITKLVKSSVKSAAKLWNKVVGYEAKEYTLSGYDDQDVINLGKELSLHGLGYFIGYYTTSWANYSYEFIFRKRPHDVRKIFIEIVRDELEKILTSVTPEIKWCIYLKHIYPKADQDFVLLNTTIRYLPEEMRKACLTIPNINFDYLKDITEMILLDEKERIAYILRSHFIRDWRTALVLGLLLLMGEEKERYFEISRYEIDKLKEVSRKLFEQFSIYSEYLRNTGIILVSKYNSIIIPKLVNEAFTQVMMGGAIQVKFFDSNLDARSFIEEELGRATQKIKIWDPYVSARTLRFIEGSVNKEEVAIEILSSLPRIADEIIRLQKDGFNLKARIIYKKEGERYRSPFHDRYLIIDDTRVWHFGPSIHAAGEKEYESATLLPESYAKMITQAFEYNINRSIKHWKELGYSVVKLD